MEIEIPFGAFDSELMHQEINIPEGFEATIEGNKVILKKIESKDERIRRDLITFFQRFPYTNLYNAGLNVKDILAWLEKQGEQKPWSEEDKEHVESILERLEGMCKKDATFTRTRFAVSQDINWLKSLKQRIGE